MDRLIDKDPALALELGNAVRHRADNFTPHEIPPLNELIQLHHKRNVANNNAQVMCEQVRINATELDERTFKLFLQQLHYDAHAFKCYVSRGRNVEASTFREKQEWLVQAHQMSEATAKYWWGKQRHSSERGAAGADCKVH